MEETVKDWIDQAKADLKTATDSLTAGNYYASAFFSQQSAEKSLKAVYIHLKNALPPKIHDLVSLGGMIDAPNNLLLLSEKLTATYIFSRYPGAAPKIPVKFYTKEKAEIHLKEAEAIVQWAKKKIEL
ncbi:MAG TPA: HEPN domain-containing protein [Candidatus Nanoarchaeia archaeon]|nr:HEPN domain-containing protein [Candidatus Nanoarchaeia archaeon]